MIEYKKKGKIRFLLAGPNIVDDVLSENQIVADQGIDRYIVPSEWVKRLAIRDCNELKDRVICWPAGIDCEYWRPQVDKNNRDKILIYWKTEPEDFCRNVIELTQQAGLQPVVLKYGHYQSQEYRQLLDRSRFAIFISRSESQGLALMEAWAMEVPTFVFDPGEFFFHGRMLNDISACPYLTASTGSTWKTLDDLKMVIEDKDILGGFSPREYAVKYFSDKYRASELLRSIERLEQRNFSE